MTKHLRRLLVGAVAVLAVSACDDGTSPPATADVEILAYVDVDESNDFDAAADDPIEGATVTLSMAGSDAPLTAQTNASGVANFAGVEIGSYTASIELPTAMTGVELASASTPTVTVDEDANVSASFRYVYIPGSLAGIAYVGGDSYAEGDPLVSGIEVTVSGGGETWVDTTDATGAYMIPGLLPGDYTVEATVPAYLSTTGSSQTVSVGADEDATADFAFAANATHTIAQARALAAGEMAAVIGVAITGNTGDQAALSGSTVYLQDAEGGIAIYLADTGASIELGDEVLIYGERGAFNDEVQLAADAAINLGAGTLPTPVDLSASGLNAGDMQGELVVLQDVYVDSIDGPNVWVTELETGVSTLIYVDGDSNIDTSTAFSVGSVYDVTGVAARFRDLMELKPRMPSDVVLDESVGMTIADVRASAVGATVEVTGVVTEPGNLEGNGFYMEDATAGIFVYMGFGNVPAGLEIGDVVTVSGDRAQFFDIAQIGGTVTVTEIGTVAVEAAPITVTQLNSGDFQGRLVQLTDVVVSTIDGSNIYVKAEAGAADSAVVRLDSDSGVAASGFAVGETYTIRGVVSNFGGTEQVKPRFPEDVEGTITVAPVTTIAEARAGQNGDPVELTGVVTVTNGPSGMLDSRNAYMQDATGGILIRMPVDSVVELGDSITVTGTRASFSAELQISVEGLTRHGTGTIPTPVVVTPADIEAGDFQGELAVLEGVEVTAINGAEVTVTDGTNSTIVYIDSTTGIDAGATFTVGSLYDVVGVVSRYNDIFELKPRQQSDITAN